MIETINLSNIELVSNFVIIKVDKDHDFIEIPGPNGVKIELQLINNSITNPTGNLAITGVILKTPKRLLFHGELKTHQKGITIAGKEFEALMRETMPHDVDLDVKEGDKVIFDYKSALNAENDGRLLKDENGNYCVLMKYDTLFAKEINNEVVPINGWVFFLRDQKPHEWQTESGLWCVEKENKYGINRGVVVSADKPVRSYIDNNSSDGRQEYNPGDKILVQRGFGWRIAYDVHADKLKGVECIRHKNILGVFN